MSIRLAYLELVVLAHYAAPADSEDEDTLADILNRAEKAGADIDALQERLALKHATLEK